MQDKMLDAAIAAVYEETAAMMKRGFSDLSIQADVVQSCSDTVAKILKLKSENFRFTPRTAAEALALELAEASRHEAGALAGQEFHQ